MYNRRYDKAFIFMKQETAGYSVGERPLRGSCTIEIKRGEGRLTLFAQDLKQPPAGRRYVFCAVSARIGDVAGIRLCTVDADKNGRTDIKLDFEPENFFGTGRRIEEFNVFAVLAESAEYTGLGFEAPLCGYVENKVNWKGRLKFIEAEDADGASIAETAPEAVDKTEPDAEIITATEIAEPEPEAAEYTIVAAENPEMDKMREASDTFRQISEKFNQELEELKNAGTLTADEVSRILSAAQGDQNKDEIKAEDSGTATDRYPDIEYAMQGGREINPFMDGGRWRAVELSAFAALPYDSCRFMKRPFITSGYRRYKHIILGSHTGRYYIGVPAEYDKDDALYASRLGFDEFRRLESGGDCGYWIKEILC